MTDTTESMWPAFAADVEAWDGETESGRALLARLAQLPEFRGKASGTIDSLRKYQKGPEHLLKQVFDVPLVKDGDPEPSGDLPVSAAVLRLIACDDSLVWPWATSGDANLLRRFFVGTVGTVRTLSRHSGACAVAIAPRGGSLEFLSRTLRLKQREQWIPVVAQLAEVLGGERASVLEPLGLEAIASTGKKEGGYSQRHLCVLSTLTSAVRGGKFAGKDGAAWVDAKDRNSDDLSAIALACAELAARRPSSSAALEALALRALTRASEPPFYTQLNYQHAEAARRVIEVFGERDVAWRVLLRGVPTTSTELAAERLFEAHRTLLWLRQRGDEAHESHLTEGALACAPSVVDASRHYQRDGETVRGEASGWLPALRDALAQLEETTWDGSPVLAQAVAIVTALVLVRAPLAQDIDWPKAVAAAGATWLEPSDGKTKQRGWVDLVGLAAGRGALFRYLLHRGDLDGIRETPKDASGGPAKKDAKSAEPKKEPKAAKGDGDTDLYAPRQTVGLARLLRARWQQSSSSGSGLRVDKNLTDQCALHLVRRLAIADANDASQVLLAALAADAPQSHASLVDSGELKDELWQNVRRELPEELDREPLGAALKRLVELEQGRKPDRLDEEASGYRAVTALFGSLHKVSDATDAVWTKLRAMQNAAPPFDGDERIATPEQARRWLSEHARGLAQLCDAASKAIEEALGEQLPDHALRAADVDAVRDASDDELVTLEHPMLEEAVGVRWRAASVSMRRLAEPLPWFVEAALDDTLTRFDHWLDAAERNQKARTLLLERIESAVHDDDEAQLVRVLEEAKKERVDGARGPTHFELLDAPKLRAVSNFWLRRLRFDQNKALPRHARSTSWSYYGPLMLAVLGAPLTTVQTNYLWAPLIGDPSEASGQQSVDPTRFAFVTVLFLSVCFYGLWGDLRTRLRGLPTRTVIERAIPPLSALLGLNYALSALLHWIVDPDHVLDTAAATLLWGTLSLYLGLFLGLLAQGNRIDREDVSDN